MSNNTTHTFVLFHEKKATLRRYARKREWNKEVEQDEEEEKLKKIWVIFIRILLSGYKMRRKSLYSIRFFFHFFRLELRACVCECVCIRTINMCEVSSHSFIIQSWNEISFFYWGVLLFGSIFHITSYSSFSYIHHIFILRLSFWRCGFLKVEWYTCLIYILHVLMLTHLVPHSSFHTCLHRKHFLITNFEMKDTHTHNQWISLKAAAVGEEKKWYMTYKRYMGV